MWNQMKVLQCFVDQQNVTLSCGRTQNKILISNVSQLVAKWYSLMFYPLYFDFKLSVFLAGCYANILGGIGEDYDGMPVLENHD